MQEMEGIGNDKSSCSSSSTVPGPCLSKYVDPSSEESHRYYLARRNALEMLRDRGYEVSLEDTNLSLQDFRTVYGERPDVDRLRISAHHRSDSSNKVKVVFFGTSKVKVNTIRINLTKHVLSLRHRVLTDGEKKALLKHFNIEEKQLPRISKKDAVVRYYGLEKGQVVKVSYRGELTESYVAYRCVKILCFKDKTKFLKDMETPPFIRSFGDNQSSLMDRFERLSFEAHLSNALLGRSLSESGFSSMYNAVLDDPPPVHVEDQDCHRVRRGLRLNKMLKNLMKPIRYCSRRISRGKKQDGYDLDARSFKKWQTFSKSKNLIQRLRVVSVLIQRLWSPAIKLGKADEDTTLPTTLKTGRLNKKQTQLCFDSQHLLEERERERELKGHDFVVVEGKDQMHSTSIPAGDLEKQQDKAPEKQSESVNESATEVNLTIVVCNGDSSGAHETVEVAQIYGPAEREESPKKVCLSRNSSSHEQCRVCQQEKEEALIELGCLCRGGLAKSHRSCIDAWFRTKGSNQCEICQAVAVYVPPPETQPTTNYWVWRIDPSYRQEQRERGCFSPLWVAFSILIGGLMLDVLISITLGVSALPVNIIIGVIVVLGLGTALRLTLEFCYEWSLRRAVQRAVQRRETAFNNIAYPSAFPPVFFCENQKKRKSKEMDAKIGKFFDSVGSFFSGGDKIPWSEGDVIAGCEREVREATNSGNEGLKKECLMRLSWALVHSHQQDDVQRGIDMLEASLANSAPPLEDREKLYLLAVGYYRSGDCSKSRQLIDRCIEMQPDWRQALVLKKCIEDKITKDGVIGIGITASAVGAVGLIAGGIVAALARKK
ncbi:hypothetical protein HID58_082422 [Brassica napus]|uniref:RING-CH-type domain-containing protein n=2 Tax=Brassica TaxID=3705 RepID=A0ABQ7YDC0_BRANA|nr:hypothetical protein HID58_082422 [Brassica napus]